MSINDKLWLVINQKPPTKWLYYLTIYFAGFMSAVFLAIGWLIAAGTFYILGWSIIGVTIAAATISIVLDNKYGFVEALHKQAVLRWHEKRRRLGVK